MPAPNNLPLPPVIVIVIVAHVIVALVTVIVAHVIVALVTVIVLHKL